MNTVEEYREMAEVHSAIDYGDPKSVKRGNKAADVLRNLGRDRLSADALSNILASEHSSSLWAAHHLLEFHDLTDDQSNQAIRRIEAEISNGGVTAMGERMFLAEITKRTR